MTGPASDAAVGASPDASADPYAYDAFISYSRSDAPFARQLARALDRYRPPKGLGLAVRNLRAFRDEADLTGSEYYDSIDLHLARSKTLIVVCSPAARKSEYVNDEIRRFAASHDLDRIVPVLVEGIPNNEAGPDDEDEQAFPEALCDLMEMPLAASFLDFDPRRDRPDRGRFQAAWYAVLANVCEVSRRDIERRDVKRRYRRRATATATTAAVMAALIGLTTYATVQRGLADTRRGQAEGLIDFMLTDLRDKLEPIGRLEILADVGDQALAYFSSLPEDEFSDEELLSRSQSLYQIGEVRLGQGSLADAQVAFTESLRLARALTLRDPTDTNRLFGQSQSHFWVGYAAWLQRDLATAEREFQGYMEIAEALVAHDSTIAGWQVELGYAHSNLGSVREERRDLEGALEAFRANLAISRRLVALEPGNADHQVDLAVAHNKVGVVLQKLGRLSTAADEYEANLAVTSGLVEADSTNAVFQDALALSHLFLGDVRRLLGDEAGAGVSYRENERIFEKLVQLDPANVEWAGSLAIARRHVGSVLLGEGDLAGAEARLASSLDMLEALAATDPDRFEFPRGTARARWVLAALYASTERLDEALAEARGSAQLLETVLTRDAQDQRVGLWLGESRLLEGDLFDRMGSPDSARIAWEQALSQTAGSAEQANGLDLRARALLRLGRTEEANAIVERLTARGYRSPELAASRARD